MQISKAELTPDGIILTVSRDEARRFCYSFKPGEYDIKKTCKKRSLDANAYAWKLINDISLATRISPEEVYRQSRRECYITGDTQGLNRHHVYGGGRRQAADKWGCWVWLRWDWHTGAEYSVHRNRDFDLRLKRECQERFEELYGHEKFMEVFGKSWI